MTTAVVFYSSRRGEGDAQRLAFPCIRIMASPSRASLLRLDAFRQMTDAMAAGENAKVTVAPQKYR